MKKLLLHACCGPCSIYPNGILREQDVDFSLYFFNPNIHPYQEFKKRLQTLRDLCKNMQLSLIENKDYPVEDFLCGALNEPESRCYYCYKLRMSNTAQFAAENGFDAFSTTLLGSIYQRHDDIKYFCELLAIKHKVQFAYYDFRPGFFVGQKEAKNREMYMQSYCGCIFSERDRYEKRKKE